MRSKPHNFLKKCLKNEIMRLILKITNILKTIFSISYNKINKRSLLINFGRFLC